MEKIIRVSDRYGKKPLTFYVDLAKRRMQHHNEIEISAMGFGITTAVTAAEILKTNGFAIKDIITSTVDINSVLRPVHRITLYNITSKVKIEIVLGKTENFDNLMIAAAEKELANKESLIRVYDGKKGMRFYLVLAMRYLKQHNEVELWAQGIDITILVGIAEFLKVNGLAIQTKITTSAVDVKNDSEERLVTMEILLRKATNVDKLIGEKIVYVHSALGLWRVQFIEPTLGDDGNVVECSSCKDEKGEVTELINYLKKHKPMEMGAIIWDSKLYLVGGESYKQPEFNICTNENGEYFNRRTYVCSSFPNPSFEDRFSVHPLLGPKPRPLVVPVEKTGKTVFYVVARPSTFSMRFRAKPEFEVFKPAKNKWKKLDEPPYLGRRGHGFVAFELELNGWTRIVLIASNGTSGFYELSFDIEHKKWHRSWICRGLSPMPCSMIRVVTLGNNIRIGCTKRYVSAYKFYAEGEDRGYDETRIDVQMLEELTPYFGPYWPCEYFLMHAAVSDLGNGEVLLMTSSLHRQTYYGPNDCVSELGMDADSMGALVHYYFLKFRVWEISDPSSPRKFVAAKALNWCHKKVRVPEANDVIGNYPMLTGFVL